MNAVEREGLLEPWPCKRKLVAGARRPGVYPDSRVWTLAEGTQVHDPRWDYDVERFVGADGFEAEWSPELMPFVASTIPGWCDHGPTLMRLAQEQAPRGGQYVELGTCFGLSATWIGWGSKSVGGPPLTCVDIFERGIGKKWEPDVLAGWRANMEYAGLRDAATPIRSDSVKAGRAYAGPRVTLLYIDALHSYEACRNDFRAWAPHCADGAIVAFDDATTCYRGITQFMHELDAWPHAELLGRAERMLYWRLRWQP